jgi:UDP-N-acetylglucosamine 2-epimerase (non-hydrolysing)
MSSLVCFVVGARPNFMKAAPVWRALRRADPRVDTLLIHTDQHYDREMSDVFIEELDLPAPDVHLEVGSGGHAEQTARALTGVARTLDQERPDLAVVAGDVNSTLAAALAAVKLAIPIAHIEAGLRSFDPAMPEEHNRRLTDHVSSILLAHSASAVENLAREGIEPGRVHLVGNTMVDSLLTHLDRARKLQPWREYGLAPGAYGLVTVHRPTLVDDPAALEETIRALVRLADAAPLLFPLHPRTHARVAAQKLDRLAEGTRLRLAPALAYTTFLGLEAEARFVVTDSGGVQEETSVLGVPCFTVRDTTERPVTIELGTNTLLGTDPGRIGEIPALLAERRPAAAIPFWDGHAGERAADVLVRFLARGPAVVEALG